MQQRTGGRAAHFGPHNDDTRESREANKGEGEENLRVVLQEAGAARVVGEDLGVLPDYVRPNLRSIGIAGFKIPHWEIRDGMIIPGNTYDHLSVATYATHDHEPIRTLWEQARERPESDTRKQAQATLHKIAISARADYLIDQIHYEKGDYQAI